VIESPTPGWQPTPRFSAALFADLYELTMLQAYFEEQMHERAVFSLFVRRLPHERNYLLACGLEAALQFLEQFQFDAAALAYLASLGRFSDRFLRHLETLRFTGDVYALPEGTPVFAGEPILEIEAPIAQAQLVETFVMNQVHLQTVLASKAARVVHAAAGRPVIDFGLRRIHGIDAGLKSARAFYIAGIAATSNLAAGQAYNIPVAGTMAHSYIQAHEDELDAFRAFVAQYPDTTLLVDTYDTLEGVNKVIDLSRELEDRFDVSAVRLDSGDLGELAREARRRLDAAGLTRVKIFASGGLNETEIDHLVRTGAPVDAFGVGTDLGVSRDAPSLDIAYKLVEYAGRGRLKLSTGKVLLPGAKQVFRREMGGLATGDVIAGRGERHPGRPLLERVMRDGAREPSGHVSLNDARSRCVQELTRLPMHLRELAPADLPYPVEISGGLAARAESLRREHLATGRRRA
jgi:nicotinate phosphoribosyltransferase